MSTDASSSQLPMALNSQQPTRKTNSKDDEICDDWEQLDQIQIKKSLQSIKLTQTNDNEEKSIKGIAKPNILINPSTNQSNPMNNNPIKILRRPPSDKNLKDMGSQNQNNVVQPIKTFEQREQEYAQARLRILGSAHPEEDKTSNNPISNISTNNNPNYNNNNMNNYQQNNINNYPTNGINQRNQNYIQNSNNLVREPIGPDGSRGFTNNRNFSNNQYGNSNNSNGNYQSNYKNKS